MLNVSKIEGKNKEEILKKYLIENKLTEKDILYKEEEIAGKLFQAKKAEVTIVKKEDIKNFIKSFVKTFAEALNAEVNMEIRESDDCYNINILGENNSVLIGKDGKTINSIQLLLHQAINTQTGISVRINVDVANYKVTRDKRFEREIKRIVEEILNSKISVKLDPMNSYERRIVHTIVSQFEELSTESIGEAPERYVIIKYKED